MNRGRSLALLVLGHLLWVTLGAGTVEAQTYFTVPFTYNAEISSAFPSGSMTLRGVPFVSPASGLNYWNAETAGGPNPRTLNIPVNRYGVSRVYTIVNTFWGKAGGPFANLEFWGDSGAYYRKDLYGNVDIRDFNKSTWTNNINGTTSVNVFDNGQLRLDRQRIDLPPEFANQALVRIRVSDSGASDFQRIFLYGVTVESLYGVGGSMAQLASAGSWMTTITLMNPGAGAAMARLRFFDNDGRPLRLPLTFSAGAPEQTASLDRTLQPGAALLIQTTGPDTEAPAVGWMQLNGTGSITAFAVFRQRIGESEQEAVVPLEPRDPQAFLLWFDNTAGFATGVALANTTSEAAIIPVVIRDDTGRVLNSSTIALAGRGHSSFSLAEQFPVTAGVRGTVEFRKPSAGAITVLGLRFNPRGAFTTVPAVTR